MRRAQLGGTDVCPAIYGATNWWSSSCHPGTKLFYLMALESCDTYTKADEEWQRGRNWMGGATRRADGASDR